MDESVNWLPDLLEAASYTGNALQCSSGLYLTSARLLFKGGGVKAQMNAMTLGNKYEIDDFLLGKDMSSIVTTWYN